MPSKRTTKRVKYTLSKAQADFATTPGVDTAPTSAHDLPAHAQSSKALDLPLELLMEVLSYFRSSPIMTSPTEEATDNVGSIASENNLERTDVLRSLSQTCRLWRDIFFPILWERLDVTATHSESGAWYKVFGEALIKKSLLVSQNPEIAGHVRYTMPISCICIVAHGSTGVCRFFFPATQ